MAFIEIRDLTIEFTRVAEDGTEVPGTRALDGISLDIEKGSFVSVTGMKMNTRDDNRLWDIRSRVGMVFQNPDNQIVSSIVEDDVAFGPENLGIPPAEIRRRVDDALRQVGMYEHRLKGAHMLSGGQKQRVAIAGAIAMRPECIVFDEPTAMLDPMGREAVLRMILDLNAEGITTILITHFMNEAARADRMIVMQKGKLLADGSPSDIFSDLEMIKRAGLELPPVIELREKAGLSRDIMTAEEMAAALKGMKDR